MTAAGSVVETTAPSSRQTASGTPGERPQRQADDGGGDKGRDDRQHEDRRRVLEDAAHVAGERRLEDEQRQEDVDEGLGAERQIGEQPDDLAEIGATAACATERPRPRRSPRRSRRGARPARASAAPRAAGSRPRPPAGSRIRPERRHCRAWLHRSAAAPRVRERRRQTALSGLRILLVNRGAPIRHFRLAEDRGGCGLDVGLHALTELEAGARHGFPAT